MVHVISPRASVPCEGIGIELSIWDLGRSIEIVGRVSGAPCGRVNTVGRGGAAPCLMFASERSFVPRSGTKRQFGVVEIARF